MDSLFWFFAGALTSVITIIVVVGTYLFNPLNQHNDNQHHEKRLESVTKSENNIPTRHLLEDSNVSQATKEKDSSDNIYSDSESETLDLKEKVNESPSPVPENLKELKSPVPEDLSSSDSDTNSEKDKKSIPERRNIESSAEDSNVINPPKHDESQSIKDHTELNHLFNTLTNNGHHTLVINPPPVKDAGSAYFSLNSYGGHSSQRTAEEKSLIFTFTAEICNREYKEALEIVQKSGYELHPLYVGISHKMPRKEYSSNVIGVRIKDTQFSYTDGIPSKYAIVTEIIDIGGVDVHNLGTIKL